MEYINSFDSSQFPGLSEPPMAHVSASVGRHILLLGGYRISYGGDARTLTAFDKHDILTFDALSLQLDTVEVQYDLGSIGTFPPEFFFSSGMSCATDSRNRRVYLFGGYSLSKLEAGNALYYLEIGETINLGGTKENIEKKVGENSDLVKKMENLGGKVGENIDLGEEVDEYIDLGALCRRGKVKCRLVFLGGSHDGGAEEEHRLYPSYRDKSSMVCWKGQLVVFGGYGCHFERDEQGHSFLSEHGEYVLGSGNRGWSNQLLVFDTSVGRWRNPRAWGTAPCPRAAHSAAVCGDSMFVFGGRLGVRNTAATIRCNQLYELNLRSMSWSQVRLEGDGGGLVGRSWTSFTPLSRDNAHFFVLGGFSGDNVPLCDAHTISISDNNRGTILSKSKCFERAAWSPFMNAYSWNHQNVPLSDPLCRMWHSASLAPDGRVYIFGGCQNNLIFEVEKIQTVIERVRASPPSLYRCCLWALISSHSVVPRSSIHNTVLQDLLLLTL